MSEQPAAGRDVLAELDSIRDYLLGLCGENPLHGLASNARELASKFVHLRAVAQNTTELAAVYASGVTPRDLLEKSMGQPLTDDQVRHMGLSGSDAELARLREENDRLKAAAAQGGQA